MTLLLFNQINHQGQMCGQREMKVRAEYTAHSDSHKIAIKHSPSPFSLALAHEDANEMREKGLLINMSAPAIHTTRYLPKQLCQVGLTTLKR